MEAILGGVLGAVAVICAYLAFAWWQGDADIVLQTENARPRGVSASGGQVRFDVVIPVLNRGKQDGMVLEVLARPGLVSQLKGRATLRAEAVWAANGPDGTGYCRATLLKRQEALPVLVSLEVRFGPDVSARDRAPQALPPIPLAIHYEFVGRKQIEWRLAELVVNPGDFTPAG